MATEPDDGWVDSPFKTKGVLYLGTQSYFAAQPNGLEAVVEQLPVGRLRDFIAQKFLVGGQYEIMVVPALIEAEARAVGKPLDRYLLERTRWQAERDIHGVYKLLLKLTSPETVAARLPKLTTQMFSLAAPQAVSSGPKGIELTVTGVPAALVPWLHVGFEVYCATAMTLAGAKQVQWRALPPLPEAPHAGFPMRTMRVAASWS